MLSFNRIALYCKKKDGRQVGIVGRLGVSNHKLMMDLEISKKHMGKNVFQL